MPQVFRSIALCRVSIAFLMAFLSFAMPGIPANLGEYEVKAAFLVNFTHFVEWPSTVVPASSFQFCIVGADPFGKVLENVVGQRTVNDRPITIKRLTPNADLSECRIAFLNEIERPLLSKVVGLLEQAHALTVGNSRSFAERDGIVGFVIDNDRIGLALNVDHAARAGLKLNSQLLRVAQLVQAGGKEGGR